MSLRILSQIAGLTFVSALGLVACSGDKSANLSETSAKAATAPAAPVDFRVSCTETAVLPFDKALSLLHHMMYVEAKQAFTKIAADHPDCAMAHWGIASSLFQPLWPTRPSAADLQLGWSLVNKARDLNPTSARDQALLDASAEFYRQPGELDWWGRIGRWSNSLSQAYARYSDDPDVAAFYALSRLALAGAKENAVQLHEEAAEILLAVHDQRPQHPGAVHYTIHANDAEGREKKSLEVVRSYSAIAPEVPHALHMPTHIFVRLGDWPEVIDWNTRSAAAAQHYPAGDRVSHHYIHAVDYAVYAELQQGKDRAARQRYEQALGAGMLQPSFVSAYHMAALPARLVVERRAWDEALVLAPRTPAYLPWDSAVWAEGLVWLARGLGAVHSRDKKQADEALEQLTALRDRARKAGEAGFANYLEIDRLIVAGYRSSLDGQKQQAIDALNAASQLEASVEKHPVTPGAVLPANEALGDLYMMLVQPLDALAAYQAANTRWPGRYNSLLGAARAAAAANQPAAARSYYEKLLKQAADSPRPGIQEAREYLAGSGHQKSKGDSGRAGQT